MDRDAPHVLDIAASARLVCSYVEGVTQEDFMIELTSEIQRRRFVQDEWTERCLKDGPVPVARVRAGGMVTSRRSYARLGGCANVGKAT